MGKQNRKSILSRVLIVIVLAAILGGLLTFLAINSDIFKIEEVITDNSSKNKFDPVDEEIILANSTVDDKHGAKIDAMDGYGLNDTWSIYIYMVGSDLEDCDEKDLSDIVDTITEDIADENSSEKEAMRRQNIRNYIAELNEQGMDLPLYFYYATNPVASSKPKMDKVIVADDQGCADMDIEEMLAADLSDNIQIVIQTGGATRWTNDLINPNRTQRFLINSDGFKEIENLSLEDSCSIDTLEEYLRYCNENYDADHKILIFWDHGSGPFGYGVDDIFNSSFTLKELNEALSNVYESDIDNPPFELIGFDACLMANAEVANALDGFGKYFVGSEEEEPSYGWYYTPWLNTLSQNLGMNGAQVGKEICDSYINSYVAYGENTGETDGNIICFSVLDIHEAKLAYDAYCDLMGEALQKTAENSSEIGTLAKAVSESTRYGLSDFNILNTVDIGNFMDNLEATYELADDVKNQLEKAVLYNRTDNYLKNSTGLSVYFPFQIDEYYGLVYYLDYINNICEDEATKALYYYKYAGCLNEELTDWCIENGYGTLKKLDTTTFSKIADVTPVIEGNNVSVQIGEEAASLMQSASLYVAFLDSNGDIMYYGNDDYLTVDSSYNLCTDFDGYWASVNGIPLSLEIITTDDSTIIYRSKVYINDVESYLMIIYDKAKDEYEILGASEANDENEDVNAPGSRYISILNVGDEIRPMYEMISDGEICDGESNDCFIYDEDTKVEDAMLEDGTYLEFFNISDTRNDQYSSSIIEFTIENGEMKDIKLNSDYQVVYEAD